ncbi:hypothetical protein BX600DRAFT_436440 [Xylariales sp. PMI_506]|nr:hypothetical protein BX600DRAFT_436440 [Xylariales sp. PMI_506]
MPPVIIPVRGAEDDDDDWVSLEPCNATASSPEPIADRVRRVQADQDELIAYYKVEISETRYHRFREFFTSELASLQREAPFESYSQGEKADYILLQNYLNRARRTLDLEHELDAEFAPFTEAFVKPIVGWIESRMRVSPTVDPKAVAASFTKLLGSIARCREDVDADAAKPEVRRAYSRRAGYRAAGMVDRLRAHLRETHGFYTGYDPLWDWWVKEPYARLDEALAALPGFFREKLVGIKPGSGDDDAIVGQPIGRSGLLSELEAEMIPYSPEELIRLAEKEYTWCETQMLKASRELGFGEDWRAALEHVKGLCEPPGNQPAFIKDIVAEATSYVKENSLVTVPRLAEEAIRMVMIPPAQQRVSPFFLGGPVLYVSYPRADMAHGDKLMSMRGNNRHFSKATAFHEMIPGHHLQLYTAVRGSATHRAWLFQTPFYIEGWALYWEMVFWARGDFFTSAEDEVGTLFWRMHRCARIVFSLRFHLGQMSPEECIDLLVRWVGHERANAEGEVRRSLNGDYSPLYQAAYLLGALQLWKLRGEVLDGGVMGEKQFHDAVLAQNMIPIEMLRAILLGQELRRDFKSSWRFYGDI